MFSRRQWMILMGAAASPASAQEKLAFPGKRPMLVQNDFPEDLESPVEYFDTWITPNDSFFVRQHLPRPKIDLSTYKIQIGGLVASPVTLTLDDLKKLPQAKVPATLECAGNGRSYYRPRIPGLQWSKGAIGNAEWRGPKLSDVLKRAGVKTEAKFGSFNGADVGVAKTPDFIRSVPVRKMMLDTTILALEMNGEASDIHGVPARLIVPGWDGASWVKWVTKIDLVEKSDPGFYMATAYRYPKHLTPPGVAAKPEDMEVLEGMAVKSFFARPAAEEKLRMGTPTRLQGIAWAGENRITRVEVSTDGGSKWQDAKLSAQNFAAAWRLWTLDWTPATPGYRTLAVRATDSAGRTQPLDAPWNPSGYLWNGIDRVGVNVEA